MIRDASTRALLSTDTGELNRYRMEKRREKDIAELKREVSCLKSLINTLVEKIEKLEKH
jgi:hypothetical protein